MGNIHSINIGGSTYVIEPKTVKINDVRGADRPTSYFADYTLTPWFNEKTGFSTSWASGITMKGWTNDYQSWQLAAGSTSSLQPELKFRNGINDAWRPWKKVILEGDAATKAKQANKIAIHTKEFIQDSGLCSLDGMYEVPVILGGCDCTVFSDQPFADYFGLMTDYHPQTNNSNWLRYNFNDQTLKSTNFEGNLTGDVTGNASSSTTVNVTTKSTAGSFPLIFGPTSRAGQPIETGNKSLYTDSANNLYYNPNTNTLTTTTFSGSLSGNASSATNATYINVASSSTNDGTYMLTFVNGTGNRKAYTNSGVCVNPYSKTIIADQIIGFGTGSWNQDYVKATTYNGSISSGSSWSPVCAVRTSGGVWSMGHIWPGDSQNYLSFSYVGDSLREINDNRTLKLPVPKYNRTNFIPIGDQQFDGKPAVARIVTLSSSQYTNLTSKDPNTLYLII